MENVTFYIVRHGQTDWNITKKLQGHTDIPLNNTGRSEALALSDELKTVSFSASFSSDLSRAHETALIITENSSQSLSVHKDLRLRERYFGSWEGGVFSEFQKASPEEKKEAETVDSVQERMLHFLHEIREKQDNQANVLVVTHGGVIKNLMIKILDLPLHHDVVIQNTGVLILTYSEGKWSVQELKGIEVPSL